MSKKNSIVILMVVMVFFMGDYSNSDFLNRIEKRKAFLKNTYLGKIEERVSSLDDASFHRSSKKIRLLKKASMNSHMLTRWI